MLLALNKKPHLPASPVPMEWLNLEGIGDKKKKKKNIYGRLPRRSAQQRQGKLSGGGQY
jgi:hypothetical protein